MVDGAGGFLTAFRVAMSVGRNDDPELEEDELEEDGPKERPARLRNGRRLMPGANPPGVATYGDGHGRFFDNNGDEVDGSTGSQWLRDNNGGHGFRPGGW